MIPAFISYSPVVKLHLGPLAISPHGVGIAAGFLAGARLMTPDAQKRGITTEQIYAMLMRGALGAVIGARLAYVANHLGEFSNPLEWFAVWRGGISLLGGILGGILFAFPLMRRWHLPFWATMDAAAPGLALGIVIGRIGDLIVGDHLGKPTTFFLGYRCTGAASASPCVAAHGQAVHMPALYDLVSVSLLLVVLLILRRRERSAGFLILFFAAWYSVGRIIEDFFRIDVTHGTGLTGSQWTSVATVLICVALLTRLVRGGRLGRDRSSLIAERASQSPAPD